MNFKAREEVSRGGTLEGDSGEGFEEGVGVLVYI